MKRKVTQTKRPLDTAMHLRLYRSDKDRAVKAAMKLGIAVNELVRIGLREKSERVLAQEELKLAV